jgi:hypothetical protein
MRPVTAVTEVFEALQRAKTGASAFCTNFFPVPSKLQGWIEHGELLEEARDGSVFFFRKDLDFWHLYYCSSNVPALQRDITTLSALNSERVAIDLVGTEVSLVAVLNAVESCGFRRHARLLRLARANQPVEPAAAADSAAVRWADDTDFPAIMALLEKSFDRYADQLPAPYEMEAAVSARQVLAVNWEGVLAALLFFENQGLTSTVRYWVVDQRFRSHRFGSALMRQYLRTQSAVRRFILWVTADNDDAVVKYRHYGYLPDGLIDHVLVNEMIPK